MGVLISENLIWKGGLMQGTLASINRGLHESLFRAITSVSDRFRMMQ